MSEHPLLAVDFGQARIGIAATDAAGILPYPVETIEPAKVDPLERIAQIAKRIGAKRLIVGLPLRLDGTEGTACAKVRAFAQKLHERLPALPMEFVDEFLTTTTAQKKLHAAGKKAKHFKPVIDQAAAVEILNNRMRAHGEFDNEFALPPEDFPPV